jgi:mRNA interferase MazF
VKRGEIWRVQLDPKAGSAIRKASPCVVVSPPELNAHLRTVLVAPMTSSQGFTAPFRIPVTHAGVRGLILLDRMRAVDKASLVDRRGAVSAKTLAVILKTLQEMFAE